MPSRFAWEFVNFVVFGGGTNSLAVFPVSVFAGSLTGFVLLLFVFSGWLFFRTIGRSGCIASRLGLIKKKYKPASRALAPNINSNARMPRISRSFDFFFGGTLLTGGNDPLCGNGALCAGGRAGAAGGGGGVVDCDACKLADVGEPVGPVSLGSTAVGAEDEVAMVAPKSGSGVAGGACLGGSTGVTGRFVDAIVAFGSNGLSAVTSRPPSTVQNF